MIETSSRSTTARVCKCEWLPIESAPKDGQIVDLWSPAFGRVTDQWWDAEDACWSGLDDGEFTHWMPTPEQPK